MKKQSERVKMLAEMMIEEIESLNKKIITKKAWKKNNPDAYWYSGDEPQMADFERIAMMLRKETRKLEKKFKEEN